MNRAFPCSSTWQAREKWAAGEAEPKAPATSGSDRTWVSEVVNTVFPAVGVASDTPTDRDCPLFVAGIEGMLRERITLLGLCHQLFLVVHAW